MWRILTLHQLFIENAVEKFLECLLAEEKRIRPILEHVVPMELSALDERSFQTATYCHISDEELGTDRVRDHCHLTGKYRGAAHSDCTNLPSAYQLFFTISRIMTRIC